MVSGQPVLVDTNIIIEAVRTNGWAALKSHFQIITVEKCIEEARGGDLHRAGYVEVTEAALKDKLVAHLVSQIDLAKLSLQCPRAASIDDGERHLWAHALTRGDAWLAGTADKAAFFAACELGWRERMVALETLLNGAGAKHAARAVRPQFTKARLDQWGSEFALK